MKSIDEIKDILTSIDYKRVTNFEYWIPVSTDTLKEDIFHVDFRNTENVSTYVEYRSYVYYTNTLFLAIL